MVRALPHGPLFTESANSWVPVGEASSSITQIISGIFFSSINLFVFAALRCTRFFMSAPKPWVRYTVG